jgi:photosystem II stability/assembly factor-like uncharacterized protein
MIGRWVSLGPTLITYDLGATGRITTLAIDETDSSTIYAAARPQGGALRAGRGDGGPGVWRTTNGGSTWRPIGDGLPSYKVPAIALVPGQSSPLYVATLGRNDRGGGLYRTDDEGGTWDVVSDDEGLRGRQLLIDPTDSARMFMANDEAVLRSIDGGQTWSELPVVQGSTDVAITDLAIDRATPSRLYAGVRHETSDSVAGVYASRDGGDTWNRLMGCSSGRLPNETANRNIRLAVSRGRVYVSFKLKTQDEAEWVLYRTTGVGCTISGRAEQEWERGWSVGGDAANTIWSYLYAHPADPDIVYATGTSFRRSTDAGETFSISEGPHVDHHAFAVDPSDGDIVYTGCDGGVYQSNDRGASNSWTFIGEGMTNTELYDIGHAATDARLVLGGTQDNGTILIRETGTVWDHIRGGDGATVDVDPTDAGVLYSMGQYADSIERQENGGGWEDLTAGLPSGSVCFNLHYHVHPTVPTTLLASCSSLWRTTTTQPPGDWQMIFPVAGSPMPSGNVVRSAVDGRSNTYYAATDAGELFAGADGNGWQQVFSVEDDCAGSTTRIADVEVDIDDPAVVYVTTRATDACRVVRLDRPDPDDLAMTAQDITFDLPADVIVTALAVDRLNSGTIYVGSSDRGVYRGRPVGAAGSWSWDPYSNGLPPAVAITELLVHPTTGVLRAATFGRGAFQVDTDDPIGSVVAIEGRVTFLRVHDSGGFGPSTDHLDGEVVVRLDAAPEKAFGFELRSDSDEGPHAGMLDVLRSAMIARHRVRIEYVRSGPRIGRAFRVMRVG